MSYNLIDDFNNFLNSIKKDIELFGIESTKEKLKKEVDNFNQSDEYKQCTKFVIDKVFDELHKDSEDDE